MSAPPPNPSNAAAVEAEVVANIKAQPLGPATVADLALPDHFLARVAGRVLRAWFHERFRVVVGDGSSAPPPPTATGEPADIQITEVPTPAWCNPSAAAAPPAARNFRVTQTGASPTTLDPGPASELIAESLARDGLLKAAARALQRLKPTSAAAALAALENAGLPTDLLTAFAPPGAPPRDTLPWLLAATIRAQTPEALEAELSQPAFNFRPTREGFCSLPESGQQSPSHVHLQLTRATNWLAPGDGGSLDLTTNLLAALPGARFTITAEHKHVQGLRRAASHWPQETRTRVHVLSQNAPPSQWAQDNIKPGECNGPGAVLPRFASRGEQNSQFVPGDTLAATALSHAGIQVIHSPLLFQGGNILTIESPNGARTLLIGESEVYRNQALGLSRDQVLEAFKAEFGAQYCIPLPAASIHVDYEVSIRTRQGTLIALVNDTPTITRHILRLGIEALRTAGALNPTQARKAQDLLAKDQPLELASLLGPSLSQGLPGGQFPEQLAAQFSRAPSDSGVGNFHRFLLALDWLLSRSDAAMKAISDPYTLAYLNALRRSEQDRLEVRRVLKNQGYKVLPIPSLAEGNRGISYINGIHTPNAYLMPAYGGLFSPLDQVASAAIARALGDSVRVIPIPSSESQRRDGAVHCSAAVLA